MKKITTVIYFIIKKLYIFTFARSSMQKYNKILFNLTLHGMGYNNFTTRKISGEENFIKLLSKYNPKICIDIGANVGNYSLFLLETTKTKVIAFEPLPNAFEKLSKIQKLYPNRLIAINKGVGNENKEMNIYFTEERTEHASFSAEVNLVSYVNNVNQVKVEVTSLDHWLKNNRFDYNEIDLLKIDTEGFEYEVLIGAKDTIKTIRPKFIQIEYNWHQLFKNQSLFSLGLLLEEYTAFQLLPNGLCKRDLKNPESNIYSFSNFIFIRNDINKDYFIY
ncbi:MAG: FkbM family methyltransferase [Chlorobiaceae bacterium]|nr:FkbM family methyltransferase [Chlorobiaceae bacterium]